MIDVFLFIIYFILFFIIYYIFTFFLVKLTTTELEINKHRIIMGYNTVVSIKQFVLCIIDCMYNNENLPQLRDVRVLL